MKANVLPLLIATLAGCASAPQSSNLDALRVSLSAPAPRVDVEHLRQLVPTQNIPLQPVPLDGEAVMVKLPPSTAVICNQPNGVDCGQSTMINTVRLSARSTEMGGLVTGEWECRYGGEIKEDYAISQHAISTGSSAGEGKEIIRFQVAAGQTQAISGPLGAKLIVTVQP
ncbi:hypothetical protein [Stenotrophomonas ginsengisoli]|uniref:hypothetical protein n=1 Tax=Stenotrophomonas ginsengisoli TaxID=336566 RepID=UPI00128F1A52|nr:hypothetical protein [Stenotrophomonas ginsengisoli]